MRGFTVRTVLATLLLLPALAIPAFAVPLRVPYSGQLSEDGVLVDGERMMTFGIYDAEMGGTTLYTQVEPSVAVVNGIYHVELNVPANVWIDERWLGVSVNGGSELVPRTRIGTAPYAVRSMVAESLAVTSENWQFPDLLNGWINFGAGYAPARYYKDPLGIVHVEGLVKSGAMNTLPAFILPPGYRPSARLMFISGSFDSSTGGLGVGRIDVSANGEVLLLQGSPTFFSLTGVTFRAEP